MNHWHVHVLIRDDHEIFICRFTQFQINIMHLLVRMREVYLIYVWFSPRTTEKKIRNIIMREFIMLISVAVFCFSTMSNDICGVDGQALHLIEQLARLLMIFCSAGVKR